MNIKIYIQESKSRRYLSSQFYHGREMVQWHESVTEYFVLGSTTLQILLDGFRYQHIITLIENDRVLINKDDIENLLFFLKMKWK